MTTTSRRLALATAVALALPLAASPALAAPAGAPPGPGVAELLPPEVLDDLSAAAEDRLEDALVAPGAGAVVSVAVETPGGGLDVAALEVARGRAAGVARLLDGLASVDEAGVASTVRAVGATTGTATPTADPLRGHQWPLEVLRADDLRPLAPTTPVVAVLDTGVDGAHPDLDDVLVPGVDLVGGTTGPRAGWSDPQGHGTHVAGIVAAEVGNGVGVEGLLAGARVMPVRVLGADGSGSTAAIAQGVVAAVDRGASVLNLSLGGPGDDPVLGRAVRYATDAGVVVAVAMGNDGAKGSPTSYPAAYDGVLAVAATDAEDVRASFSSTGAHADVAAPGDLVASTWPGGGYRLASGTSMATPYAAAAAAAVRGAAPGLLPEQVEDVLEQTARDLGPAGRDDLYGWGRVVPVAAVQRAVELAGRAPQQPGPEQPGPQQPGPQQPGPQQPGPQQPGPQQPGPQQPGPQQPGPQQPGPEQPGPQQPGPEQPGPEQPAPADPAPSDPAPADPAPEDPAPEDPAPEEPAPEEPVQVPPGAPASVAAAPGEASAVVRWDAPAAVEGAAAVTGYEVRLPAGGSSAGGDQVVTTGPDARTATVPGLRPGTTYRVEVRALSAVGAGAPATTQVRPVAPATAPRTLRAVPGAGRAVVSWATPTSTGTGGTGYEVVVSARGRADVVVRTSAQARSATVTGLADGVDHVVAVRLLTAGGPGPAATAAVRPRTTSSAPQQVSLVAGSTRDRATGVVVGWAPPASDGGTAVTAYRLLLRAEGSSRDVVVTVRAGGTGAHQVSVTGLRRGTRYSVAVQAVTAAGPGAASARTAAAAAR